MNHIKILEDCPICHGFLLFLGLITMISTIYSLISFIYRKFIRSPKDLMKLYGNDDKSWAVVSGSSDGIGLTFCESLAKRGFNICFIARNPEKLAKVSNEFKVQFPLVKTAVIIVDFSFSPKNPLEFYSKINDELVKKNIIDIAILINNVGCSDLFYFEKMKEKSLLDMLSTNIYPAVFLTKLIIPKMMNRNRRSLIINLASASTVIPAPYLSVYAATKTFNSSLAKCLALEYKGNIDFMSLKPNLVSTNMSQLKPGRYIVTTKECVEGCLRDVGWEGESTGSWKHAVFEWFLLTLYPTKLLVKEFLFYMKKMEEGKKKD